MPINPKIISRSVRNSAFGLEVRLNRLLKREFIPPHEGTLSIETSSLCNLKCRFCAYEKKQGPRLSMTDAFFIDCITQALDMGYRSFNLTPCTGDIFMDRHIFNKLGFLDGDPRVEGYGFFTNLTIPKQQDVVRLAGLKKLKYLVISVYGHDPQTFIAITKSTEKIYHRLVGNLETLLSLVDQKRFDLDIALRSTMHVPRRGASSLMRTLRRFEDAGVRVHKSSGLYNNWGGYITQDDVKGLPIRVGGADQIRKDGACTLLLTTVQVTASGIVNGCACRDVDSTLRIGDLKTTPLREIISSRNPAYMRLIDEQQDGLFRPICKSCDFYQSIYHNRRHYRRSGIVTRSLAEFKAALDANGQKIQG
jgi:MoaA/NifB/PqqE/SkfB family radical SAM enzyme